MKIALCISGMMRTYQKCFPTIVEHIIKANPQHEFETFIATWDIHGRNPVWWEVSKDNTPVDFTHLQQFPELNIKKLLVESFTNSDFMKDVDRDVNGKYSGRTGERSNPYNYLPMIYKIQQSYDLMDHVKSPLIVRMRSDLFFTQDVHFTMPGNNVTVMPQIECWGPASLNDQFAYGDSNTMRAYTYLYRFIDYIYQHTNTLHPETNLAFYYDKQGMQPMKEDILYRIER